MPDTWIAIASAALDVRELDGALHEADFLVLAFLPAEPIGLAGAPGALWRQLVEGPVNESSLDPDSISLLHEFEEHGIASRNLDHSARLHSIDVPRLSSPMHELVYGLVGTLGRTHGIDLCFIKGPILFFQGLRAREHSGDVDLWVDPSGIEHLVELLGQWGWRFQPGIWDGTHMNHSTTMDPTRWGCQLDLHEHFPGSTLANREAFEVVQAHSEVSRFASVDVHVPSIPLHAVISALHFLRPEVGRPPTGEHAMQLAIDLLRKGRDQSFDIAIELGAEAALEPALRQAFPAKTLAPQGPLPLNWVWRTKPNLAIAYLTILKHLPPRDKARMFLRTVWPPAQTVRASDEIAGGAGGSVFRMRLRRLGRGLGSSYRSAFAKVRRGTESN